MHDADEYLIMEFLPIQLVLYKSSDLLLLAWKQTLEPFNLICLFLFLIACTISFH